MFGPFNQTYICHHGRPIRRSRVMTSSNGNIFRVTGPLCGEFNGNRWIPCTKASDAELWCFFICVWIYGWVNNGEAGDLRRHHTHYDVTVMAPQSVPVIKHTRPVLRLIARSRVRRPALPMLRMAMFFSYSDKHVIIKQNQTGTGPMLGKSYRYRSVLAHYGILTVLAGWSFWLWPWSNDMI